MTLASASPWDGEPVAAVEATPAEALPGILAALDGDGRWTWPTPEAQAERLSMLARLAEVLTSERATLVELLIREAGKARADAEAEADLLATKIRITAGAGVARTPPLGDGPILWRARGPAAVIGPANFPLHLLHGLVVPAVAVGAPVLAKPSDRTPGLGAAYAAAIARAGLSRQVAVVQGGAALALALAATPGIQTVAAVGGRAMGAALAQAAAARPEVVLALELGGVNHALVLPDAQPAAAAAILAEGAWKMAGQRCTATRIAHVPRALAEAVLAALVQERERYRPAPTPAGLVGRMIAPALHERFLAAFQTLPPGVHLRAGSRSAAGRCACDPLLLTVDAPGARADPLYREEQFGPALLVDAYDAVDEAVARMRANPDRLAAAVIGGDSATFRALAVRLPYGQVNWNRPTAGARSDLPFGGCGRSGNGRPAAVAACQFFADETVAWG